MEIPAWKNKNLRGVQSLSQSEIRKILKLAKFFKKNLGTKYNHLKGKRIVNLFM